MDDLASLMDKARSLLARKAQGTHDRCVRTTWLDRDDYEFLRITVAEIYAQEYGLAQDVDYAADFMADLFGAFFKIEPYVYPAHEVTPTRLANRAVINRMLMLPEVTNLRQFTVTDRYATAMAMLAMEKVAHDLLTQIHKEQKEVEQDRQSAQDRAEKAAQDMETLLDQIEAHEGTGAQDDAAGALQELIAELQDATHTEDTATSLAGTTAAQTAEGRSAGMKEAANKADADLSEQQSLALAFGMDVGAVAKMDVQERFALGAKLLGHRLAQYVRALGQFKPVQEAQSRKRITDAASEIHGVTQSGDIAQIVASEYLNFADPTLELMMLARMASGQLETHNVRGKERMGQGPIIFVCDESSSMTAEDVSGGSREAWAKGLALAMLDQARQRNRDFVYIGFSSVGQTRVVEFPGGVANFDKVIDMTETFLRGGTSYPGPLNLALDIIAEQFDAHGKPRPDIVFVTDDMHGQLQPDFMKRWLETKDRASIKCYGISIGCGYSGALEQVCDNVRAITSLVSDPHTVGDLFQTI